LSYKPAFPESIDTNGFKPVISAMARSTPSRD